MSFRESTGLRFVEGRSIAEWTVIGRGFESRSGRKEGKAATKKPARVSASIQSEIIGYLGIDGNP